MFYFLKDNRFDWGTLYFDPPDDDYSGLGGIEPPIEKTKVTFKLTSPTTRKLDADFIRANRGFLCSRKMRNILIDSEANVNFLPASLYDRKGKLASDDYFLMHISNQIDCLDYTESEYEDREAFTASGETDLDVITKVNKIVLDVTRIGEANAFFVSNAPFAYLPVVDGAVGQKFRGIELKGLELIPVDTFVWKDLGVQ
ncbi:hypothetical protein INH39_07945 [Massilia violaceinigra]|uniref:Immunity MXAN-0049 protein domain-containing protein n=1 Tax=Massilia violaceinigra TaxID=2045208 RepID=A0ABY4AA03_9BURK|nr:DUF1629 domain-containing protein [Massilia violaceinigra]UOD31607.1 hypothetical protein INH39_07945 [Massilia violaceinigra]